MVQTLNCVTIPPAHMLPAPPASTISMYANNANAPMPTPGAVFTVKAQVSTSALAADIYIYSEGRKYAVVRPSLVAQDP